MRTKKKNHFNFLAFLSLFLLLPTFGNAQVKPIKKNTLSIIKPKIDIDYELSNPNCIENTEKVYSTQLFVCQSGNNCREGLGFANGKIRFPSNKLKSDFDFTWQTKRTDIDGVIWQVSKELFGCHDLNNPAGLLKQGNSKSVKTWEGMKGSFNIDFGKAITFVKTPVEFQLQKTDKHKIVKLKEPKVKPKLKAKPDIQKIQSIIEYYYVRIIPTKDGQPLNGSSNVVILQFDDLPADESEFEWINPPKRYYPDVYGAAIVEFTPIGFPTKPWGTMNVLGFDEDLYNNAPLGLPSKEQKRAIYQAYIDQQRQIIPEPYKGEGSESWLSQLWDAVNSAVNWVSESYEKAKKALVDTVGDILNAIPLVECAEKCRSLLKGGLEYGLTTLGIPPSLPNANELLDEGLEYIAKEASNQMGCGDVCVDEITEKMKEMGETLNKNNRDRIANAEEAHEHGVEPVVVPQWVKVEPAKEGSLQPPKLIVEVNRRDILYIKDQEEADLNAYFLRVSFRCTNNNYKAGQIVRVPVNANIKDGYLVNYKEVDLKLPQNPVSPLWASKLIHIPEMHQGEKVRIPILLTDTPYLFPGHLDLIRAEGGLIFTDDWAKMYMDGDLTITLEVVGKIIDSGWNEAYTTIFKTEMEYKLPNSYAGQYRQQKRIQ